MQNSTIALRLAVLSICSFSLEANAIQTENALAGTTSWQLSNPAANREIEGYGSLTSVNQGGQISLFVNTAETNYSLDIFRMGWYGGAGAREVLGGAVTLPGTKQVMPVADPVTGLTECRWVNPFTITVPSSWISGVYLAKLTALTSGKQSYIIFVVREDSRPSNYLFQSSVTTYQAYNNWPGMTAGGKSLYPFNSVGNVAAVKVSFNRPYALGSNPASSPGVGASDFITTVQPATVTMPGGWEYNMVRFLEREGFDVTYCTNVDIHETSTLLSTHRAFLSVGHDEYWSWQMRANVEAARDSGVSLGFFSSNVCYWQIRFEPSLANGAADRTMVGYKANYTQDPYFLDADPTNDKFITNQWRQNTVLPSEEEMLGVEYIVNPVDSDIVIYDPTSWALAGTGLVAGQKLTGLLGYEVDGMLQPGARTGGSLIAHSPIPKTNADATTYPFSDMVTYAVPSGATVFATGSMQWSWGLDDYNAPAVRTSRLNTAAQQITRNVLNRFLTSASVGNGVFATSDIVTKGNWPGVYGLDGALVVNDASSLPSYVSLTTSGATSFTWAIAPTASQAPIRISGPSRIAATWFSNTSFSIDVNLTDGKQHQVAIYCLDWDGGGTRSQRVDVLDAATSAVLDTRTIGAFSNGVYLIWNLTGHVSIRVTRTAGANAVVSGIFFSTPAGNQAPVVNAGPNQNITFPNSTTLNGSVTDDGLPNHTLVVGWSQVQGPGVASFATAAAAQTSVSFSAPGTYVLRLTANDGALTSTSQVTVAVSSLNQPPVVSAGSNQVISLPAAATLMGTATDDGLPSQTLTVAWSQLSGPGTAIFASPTSTQTTVTFSAPGSYVLQLSASDGALTSSSQVSLTVNGVAATTAAQYILTDLATLGNWKSLYGAEGEVIANDSSNLPAYATLAMSGSAPYTWVDPTTDPRALLHNSASGSIASTWYSNTFFTLDLNVNDGRSHQIAIYFLDWDGINSRAERVDVMDAVSNAILDSRSVSTFTNGRYLLWSVSGHVLVRVTRTGGANAVISGLFFGGNVASSPVNQAPSVSAGTNQSITLPSTAALSGTATDDGLPNHTLTYTWSKISGPGTVSFSSSSALQTSTTFSLPGTYVLQLSAFDGALTGSSQVTITVSSVNQPPVVSAGANQTIALPSTAALAGTASDDGLPNNVLTVTWSKVSGPGTVTFGTPNSVQTSATFSTAGTYALQLSASDGALTSSSQVTITVTPANQAPIVSAGTNQSITLPATAALSGSATDDGLPNNSLALTWSKVSGPGAVTFSAPNSLQTSATFSLAGTYVLQLAAFDGSLTGISQITITVNSASLLAAGNSAQYVTTDTTTQGNWTGMYGSGGSIIVNDSSNPPAYAAVSTSGLAYTWLSSSTDPRALLRFSGQGRIASTWFSGSAFTIDVNQSDGKQHRLALYCLDWDNAGPRAERIDLLDASTNVVLDSRSISSFYKGLYLVWNVSGHVIVRITPTSGNAVVSGLFWDF